MKIGDVVPDFSAVDQNEQTVTLTELLSAGPLVVYFYVKAMTPG